MTLDQIKDISNTHPIVFYDGVCNLCNGFVNHVIKSDKQAKVKFGALQNTAGQTIREYLSMTGEISTVVGMHNGIVYTHSDVLKIVAKSLGGIWWFVLPLYIIPKGLRDIVYNYIARNRYNWFGKSDQCQIPSSNIKDRFLF